MKNNPFDNSTSPNPDNRPLLTIRDLQVSFGSGEEMLPAVNGVNLEVHRGKTLALVGESGCGKSVTAFSILRLIQKPGRITGGSIVLDSQRAGTINLTGLSENDPQLFPIRGGLVSMIFQEPMTALSPVHRVGEQIMEALLLHESINIEVARKRTVEIMDRVGIPEPEQRFSQFPHELSGGLRQRIVIAMALITRPELLIADEPTTALDVTIQAQILKLIKALQREINCAVLLITHDFGVVAETADDVAVMYLGRIVERSPVGALFQYPVHPYTQGLLHSLPTFAVDGRLRAIPGSVPGLRDLPSGCAFHPRCSWCLPGLCDEGEPPSLESLDSGRKTACLRAREILQK